MVILVLIPLIYTTLFGYIYMEKTIKGLRVGVVDQNSSQLSRTVIAGFKKSERFKVIKYLNNEEELAPLIARGEIDVALVIPPNFTEDIKKANNTTIFIGANGSNMTISNTAMTGAAEIIGTISTGISIKKYQALGQLEEQAYSSAVPIGFTVRPWYNPANNYSNFLLLGYVTAVIQQVILYFTATSISEERKEGTIAELISYSRWSSPLIIGKLLPYILAGCISWAAAFTIAIKVFNTPMRGNLLTVGTLSLAFIFCISAIGIFISVIAKNSLDATQYSMIIALPSFLICGFTWPIQAMTDFYKILAHVFPLTYFSTNVRSIALMGVGFEVIRRDIYILSIAGVVFLLLAMVGLRWRRKGDFSGTVE